MEATTATVEAVVRAQLARSLGGRRGIFEAGVPGLIFTAVWLPTKDITLALIASGGSAAVLLVLRLVQRTTVQFVANAFFGIGIGWFFVYLSARGGGDANDQALAYFLPGIIYSSVVSSLMVLSCVVHWPMVGFMVGSVAGDPVAWHDNPQVVRLCSQLTWLLVMPGVIGVLGQGPVWLLGHTGTIATTTAVAILTVLRVGVAWPLRLACWSGLGWLLARNHTPVDPAYDIDLTAGSGEQAI